MALPPSLNSVTCLQMLYTCQTWFVFNNLIAFLFTGMPWASMFTYSLPVYDKASSTPPPNTPSAPESRALDFQVK